MTALAVVAIGELLVIVGLVLINRSEADRSARALIEVNESHAEERSALLNRVQNSAWLAPVRPRTRDDNGDEEPPGPPDEIAKVGTVAPPNFEDDDE